jgi:hypothetical protein
MADDYVKVEDITTPEFRVAMAYVFRKYVSKSSKAKGLDENHPDLKYTIRCLFPHPDAMAPEYKAEYESFMRTLKKQADEAGVRKWGPDKKKWPADLRTPFRDQAEKDYEGFTPGAVYIQPSTKKKRQVIDGQKNNADIVDESQFYAGCYARARVHIYAYGSADTARGFAIDLGNIQKTRDGEPLSGRLKAQDEFEPIAGASVEFDEPAVPAGGLDDLFGN